MSAVSQWKNEMSGYHNNNYASRGSGGGLFVSSSVPTAGLFGVSRGSKQQLEQTQQQEKEKQKVEQQNLESFVTNGFFLHNKDDFKQLVSNLTKSMNEYSDSLIGSRNISSMSFSDDTRRDEILLLISLKAFINDFLDPNCSKNICENIYNSLERVKSGQPIDRKRKSLAPDSPGESKEQVINEPNVLLSNLNECEASLQKLFIAVNTYFFLNEHNSGISSSDTVFRLSVSSIFWQDVLIDLVKLDYLLSMYNRNVSKITNYKSYNAVCIERAEKNKECLKYIDVLKKQSIVVKNNLIERDSKINATKQEYSAFEQQKDLLERTILNLQKNMRNSNLIADILGNSSELESFVRQRSKQPSSIAAKTSSSSQNRRVNGQSSFLSSLSPF